MEAEHARAEGAAALPDLVVLMHPIADEVPDRFLPQAQGRLRRREEHRRQEGHCLQEEEHRRRREAGRLGEGVGKPGTMFGRSCLRFVSARPGRFRSNRCAS